MNRALLVLFSLVSAKVIKFSVSLSPEVPHSFLAKFDIDSDLCSWNVRAKSTIPLKADLLLYSDLTWYWEPSLSCDIKHDIAAQGLPLNLESSLDWSQPQRGNFPFGGSPHVWYFALSSCEVSQPVDLELVLELYSDQNSHFSIEDSFEPVFYSILTVVMFFALRLSGKRLIKQFMKTGDLIIPQFGLCTAVFFAFGGAVMKSGYLWLYYYDGEGWWFCKVLGTMCETLSPLSLFILISLLGRGWTIKQRELPDLGLIVTLFILATVVFWIRVSFEVAFESSVAMHSPYDGSLGIFRVILEIGLTVLLNRLCSGFELSTTGALTRFASQLQQFGTIGCACFPTTGLISWCLSVQDRLRFISYTQNAVLVAAFAMLIFAFRDRSPYLRHSTLSSSVLPQKTS